MFLNNYVFIEIRLKVYLLFNSVLFNGSDISAQETVFFFSLYFIYLFIYLFSLFAFFRAALMAYGGSQARGSNRSYSRRPTPEPQQHHIRAESATYTTAHGNTGSLTH